MDIAIEDRVGQLLRGKGMKLATAESCTGGLIGDRITDIPGSSDYYLGGAIAYAYEAKERLLGVRHATLTQHGAVSRETVLEMAGGARRVLGADVAIAVSGIAGPGGGMPNKPVGLVWVGLSAAEGEWAWRYQFTGDRLEVKGAAAQAALERLEAYLENGLDGSD